MDLGEMLQISPRDLDDQQKDELCQNIKWLEIDTDELGVKHLRKLFKLTQEVLKYKDEQLELLMTEFDEMAKKQGFEEAKYIQNLENEIKSLKSSTESRRHTPDIDLAKENEELKYKMKTLKTNIKLQAQELDKLKKDILTLQEEKLMLQSELQSAIHESDSQSESSEINEKYNHLTENVRQKNKQISQLLTDIENLEKENIVLKEKIVVLRDELKDATKHLTRMTNEISAQKNNLKENLDKINLLSNENLALRNRIEELVKQKEDRGKEINKFSVALNTKVEELRRLVEEKQTEIKELKYQKTDLEMQLKRQSNGEIPNSILIERENQITELQVKLIEATKEIEKNTELLNNIAEERKQSRGQMDHSEIIDDLKSQLDNSHQRCRDLQEQLDFTEHDAQTHGQQLAELINQLHKYEEGQYGLSDAIREIQECRTQINIRDKQIAEMIQSLNKLQITCDEVEYENLALREKFGLPLDVPVSKHGAISKHRKQNKLIHNLQNQIELLEDEKLQIKVEVQKYKRQKFDTIDGETKTKDSTRTDQTYQSKSDKKQQMDDYKKQFNELAEENESLRKGLHEILDSIRTKRGSSGREIKSESLEKLLHILDSRHIAGWYHPAMKLQAELNTLQGINDELRNQLQLSRLEVTTSNTQLKETEDKLQDVIRKLEKTPEKIVSADNEIITSLSVPPNITNTSAEIISKLNSHLLIVLNEYHNEVDNNEKLKEKIENSKQEISVIREQVGLLYKQYIKEKELIKSKYNDAKSDREILSKTIETLQNKLENYIKSLENIPEINKFGAKVSKDLISLNRKCLYLEENEKKFSLENSKLKTEICNSRSIASDYIKDIEIAKNELVYKNKILEKSLQDFVPKCKLETANKTIFDLTTKYRDLLQNMNHFKETNDILMYKKEIELLNSEKDKLFFELLQMKTKNYSASHGTSDIEILSRKLANLELNEMSERQRADHINSLYELVKEQLKKCEEKCLEYENQNKSLLNSNLKLQLVQQELQDQLSNNITREDYNNLEENLKTIENNFQNVKNKYEKSLNRNHILEAELKTREMLKSNQNMELVNLKHLLLDLQSNSDDKALIARLSTEVVLARICESDAKNKVDILTNELSQIIDDRKYKESEINECHEKLNNIHNQYQMKIRIMQDLINSLRLQYLGSNSLSTQERTIENLYQISIDKQNVFKELQIIQKQKNDIIVLQEQLNLELKNTLELKTAFSQKSCDTTYQKILEWYKEKNTLQINELKYRRNYEIKEIELQQSIQRMKNQDNQIIKLEEELLEINNKFLNNPFMSHLFIKTLDTKKLSIDSNSSPSVNIIPVEKIDAATEPHISNLNSIKINKEIQTVEIKDNNDKENKEIIATLQEEIKQMGQVIILKETNMRKQESFINELEKKIEAITFQLNEKDNEIRINENNIRENRQQVNVIDEVDMEEHNALKKTIKNLQLVIKQKEDVITKYETLIKERRDEHSLAAAQFQQEIKELQNISHQHQKAYQELKNVKESTSSDLLPNKNAIEQYVNQVHILESHMAELQTSVTSLNTQLQASRQESVRWRTLANDRLNSIEQLRKEFDSQHEEEIQTYKTESEKYKLENISLKQDLSKMRVELNKKNSNINKELQEKDTKIHELTMSVMQLQNELKISAKDENIENTPEFSELELAKQLLQNEYEMLKKRYDQISNREKNAREEIKNLRGQLIKRPTVPVPIRQDRNEKAIREQLQKKIATLEKELSEANEKLEREAAFNETRKLKIAEDFTLWEKQKRWQQAAEKNKEKLTIKIEELDKLQQSYSSAKSIIARLEREKHILETKLKNAKNPSLLSSARIESMEQENLILKGEIEVLNTKLEMQQYHSGGLGAAMMQEKLEAQERKIAILELSAKGSVEVTGELERLNNTIASLQKTNLRLEAENLELNLDLKKAVADAPFLREQIQHLERYIDVLKSEQSEHMVTNAGDQLQPTSKKVLELEKTVLSLRRLVEKLQVENKRLHSRPCSSTSDRKASSDKLQLELKKIREQYTASVEKSTELETELSKSRKRVKFLEHFVEAKRTLEYDSFTKELCDLRAQLAHKSQLLDKVKILLQKAAVKEKFLQDQVAELQSMIQVQVPAVIEESIEETEEPVSETFEEPVRDQENN